MDGYFDTGLDAEPMSSGDDRRAELLEGISADLLEGANAALDAVDVLRTTDFLLFGFDNSNENVRKMQDEIAGVYREFSDADIDHESASGLQHLIMGHDAVWKELQRDSKPKLDDARQFLEVWRGSAANAVKAYLNELADTFTEVETKITILEADLVAAREAIASARQDLNNLGSTFKKTAEDYQKSQERKREAAMSKVLAATFAGAVTGLLTVATAGAGAAAGGGSGTGASRVSVAIWSPVSGPRRYDIAHRVAKTTGWAAFALTSMNCRLASPPIAASRAATSVPPAADRSPSSTRALSRSACRRPTSHVPALAIAL